MSPPPSSSSTTFQQLPLVRFEKPAYLLPGAHGWAICNPKDALPCRVSILKRPPADEATFDPALESFSLEPGESIEFPVNAISKDARSEFRFKVTQPGQSFSVSAYVVGGATTKDQERSENDRGNAIANKPVVVYKPMMAPPPVKEPEVDPVDASLCELINRMLGSVEENQEDTAHAHAELVRMQAWALKMREALKLAMEVQNLMIPVVPFFSLSYPALCVIS